MSDDDFGFDDSADCSVCGGNGEMECDDPIQCFDPGCDGEWGPCFACGGSGRAEDQRVW